MLITGLSLAEFQGIVRGISESRYESNVRVDDYTTEFSPTRFRAKLRTITGRGAGARTSWTGRHYPIACWHVYRDVIAEVFRQHPQARVQTGMAVYRGAAVFAEKYPATGRKNVGSQMEPVTMPELCQCEHEEEYTALEPNAEAVHLIERMMRQTNHDENSWEGFDASRNPQFVP